MNGILSMVGRGGEGFSLPLGISFWALNRYTVHVCDRDCVECLAVKWSSVLGVGKFVLSLLS